MAYDEALDKTIWETEKDLGEGHKFVVGIYCYNEGTNKVGFKRLAPVTRGDREYSFRKLGRLDANEAKLINEALTEAITKMSE